MVNKDLQKSDSYRLFRITGH